MYYRAKGVRVCRQQHEVDVAIRAGRSASVIADQCDGPYFRLRGRPGEDGLKDLVKE